jgi:hypothetical protein
MFACIVETGEAAPRTVVSGLVEHVPIEQMQVGLNPWDTYCVAGLFSSVTSMIIIV